MIIIKIQHLYLKAQRLRDTFYITIIARNLLAVYTYIKRPTNTIEVAYRKPKFPFQGRK